MSQGLNHLAKGLTQSKHFLFMVIIAVVLMLAPIGQQAKDSDQSSSGLGLGLFMLIIAVLIIVAFKSRIGKKEKWKGNRYGRN